MDYMRILHCIYDDKFTDGTIRVYEHDTSHHNQYVFVTDISDYQLKSVKSSKASVITTDEFLELSLGFDVVILHSLRCIPYDVIVRIPSKCKVVWYAWGFDLYYGEIPVVNIPLYQRQTRRFFTFNIIKTKIRLLIHHSSTAIKKKKQISALKRVDYFSGVFPYEYDLLKEKHPYIHALPVDFYYGDIDFFIKDTVDRRIDYNKFHIIIGNSGDPSNNHHDVLSIIKGLKLPTQAKIIMPMNYGGTEEYRNWVEAYAYSLFPKNALILKDYLPLNEYLELVSKCKVAIFAHERQQASDNIFMQLLYGAKVYMSETSLAYKYLCSVGFKVYSLQSDLEEMQEQLPEDIIIHNRELLVKYYSQSTILKRVEIVNDTIAKDIMKKI